MSHSMLVCENWNSVFSDIEINPGVKLIKGGAQKPGGKCVNILIRFLPKSNSIGNKWKRDK